MKKKIGVILVIDFMLVGQGSLVSAGSPSCEKILKNVNQLAIQSKFRNPNTTSFKMDVNNIHTKIQNSDIKLEDPNYEDLVKKMEILDNLAEPNVSTRSAFSAEATKTWRYGDVLLYTRGNNNSRGEKSFTGHCAVLSTTNYNVIEASKTKGSGDKVHHWNRTNLWSGASGITQYKVTTQSGEEATPEERVRAVNYGLKQEDKPYRILTTLNDTSRWYCSKLTYKMWKDVGYDISSKKFKIWVTPNDIALDANLRVVKNWDKELPGII